MTFLHVLVAVDGSVHSDLALEAAVSVARRDNATLTLIAVAPPVPAAAAGVPGLAADVDDEARGHVEHALAQIPDDISVTTITPRGKPGPRICEEADSGRYDAVFVGARGVGRAAGALVGSVSQHVLSHASVAVIVTHAPKGASA